MDKSALFQVAIYGRLVLAGGAVIAGIVTVAVGAYLIFHKRAGAAKSTFKCGTMELSSTTMGGIFVLVSLGWGIVSTFLAPKVKIDGDEIALLLKPNTFMGSTVALRSNAFDGESTADLAKLRGEFERIVTSTYAKASASKGVKAKINTNLEIQGDHPVLSMSAQTPHKSIDVKYLASETAGALEFSPIETYVRSYKVPATTLKFKCDDSIHAYLKKKRAGTPQTDLATYQEVLLDRCKGEISKLPPDERKTIGDQN